MTVHTVKVLFITSVQMNEAKTNNLGCAWLR